MRIFKRQYSWAVTFGIALTAFTLYVLLDAFVIPRSYIVLDNNLPETTASTTAGASSGSETQMTEETTTNEIVITDSYYNDGNICITITTYRAYDTDIYVADITLLSAEYLQTAFAENTYGKNITEKTSDIADENDAILAINGDYYGTRSGYVIRNGILYRSKSAGTDQEDLVIYADGRFEVILEGDVTAAELLEAGAVQVLSFGPALITDGVISVSANDEVDKAMTSNPRTAIGIIDALHYVMAVTDGRTSASEGLSLYELAQFMQTLGVDTAYNLDGGGSSTMYFCGVVVNNPTTNGKTIAERSVSDIVYIG